MTYSLQTVCANYAAVGFRDETTCVTPPLARARVVKHGLYSPRVTLSLLKGKAVTQSTVVHSAMDAEGKTPVKSSEGMKEDLKAVESASSAQGSGGGCGSCLKRMVRFIPLEYRNELVQLFKLAGPVVRSTTTTPGLPQTCPVCYLPLF